MDIAFEGIDGCGKSEQVARLVDGGALATPACAVDREGPIRDLYRSLTETDAAFPSDLTSILLAFADHARALDRRRDLDTPVRVWHRYAYSTAADAIALGFALGEVEPLLALFPPADATVLIDVSPDAALERKGGRCSLAEAGGPSFVARYGSRARAFVEYQARVADAYAQLDAAGSLGRESIVVAGDRDAASVHEAVVAALAPIVRRGLARRRRRIAGW